MDKNILNEAMFMLDGDDGLDITLRPEHRQALLQKIMIQQKLINFMLDGDMDEKDLNEAMARLHKRHEKVQLYPEHRRALLQKITVQENLIDGLVRYITMMSSSGSNTDAIEQYRAVNEHDPDIAMENIGDGDE